jgi:hypothetical protein
VSSDELVAAQHVMSWTHDGEEIACELGRVFFRSDPRIQSRLNMFAPLVLVVSGDAPLRRVEVRVVGEDAKGVHMPYGTDMASAKIARGQPRDFRE